jgi:LemA protein
MGKTSMWILMGIVLGAAALAILALIMLVGMRNRLVRLKYQVGNAQGSIDAMLKKRHDLIPNLVAAARGFMDHERDLFERVTELRTQALKSNLPASERMKLEGEISRALSGILVAVENYPQLKSDRNVLQLQAALNETEEQISASRRFYNSAVTDFNTALETFPSNLVASLSGYRPFLVFQASAEERDVPAVGQLLRG